MLPSGQPLIGRREAGLAVKGADAACVNCHRRSGLGATEGRTTIPPITGRYLYLPRLKRLRDLNVPFVEGAPVDRGPYTDKTLARAIREGIAVDGRPLSYLMPRYHLDDVAMAELIVYLKGLTGGPVPGVTDSVLHFATIITPDADAAQRDGMLDVLESALSKSTFSRRMPRSGRRIRPAIRPAGRCIAADAAGSYTCGNSLVRRGLGRRSYTGTWQPSPCLP